ncbi:MAG: class I SAM-dependent methyltransferase [Acidobacteriota bacterium]|nr:class I SAM-dependent methyltransferase [Blastocatellia bacterium]MDW8240861.1 class I SAM-dependent methyltransferase [Acidobacteriota bacterium]
MMITSTVNGRVGGSFRDPSGFVFWRDGVLYRQISLLGRDSYDRLMSSGLYDRLVAEALLIPHEEVRAQTNRSVAAYKVIRPEPIPFISYPYEWCFSQLKDAALSTLRIQKMALAFDMSLKDCSAYNIQFWRGKPVFIDTLSFEPYREGRPWVAYRQFCQHFLAPLALMQHTDIRLSQLLRVNIDGVPLDLASRLLPWRTVCRFALLSHIHLHAKSQRHYANKAVNIERARMTRRAFEGLIAHLEATVGAMRWQPRGTEWAEYYENTNYSSEAMQHKHQLVSEFLAEADPWMVWDLGANDGRFSRLASDRGIQTIAFDIDPAAVEKNYQRSRQAEPHLLPLVLDLTNPSPSLGWAHQERMSLLERGPVDLVMALALIHHLAISNNVPLDHLARFFSRVGQWLIIEFVPKSDSQVRRLLATRQDVFPTYTQVMFEQAFQHYFTIRRSVQIEGSERTLYLMRRRDRVEHLVEC